MDSDAAVILAELLIAPEFVEKLFRAYYPAVGLAEGLQDSKLSGSEYQWLFV